MMSQTTENVSKKTANTILRFSFGFTSLSLANWCDYLKSLESEHSSVRKSKIRNWGNTMDLGILVRIADQFSVGGELTYLYSKMYFSYPSCSWISGVLNYYFGTDEVLTSVSTRSGLYQPVTAWYFPVKSQSVNPFILVGIGYGETRMEFNNSAKNQSLDASGSGLVSTGTFGLDAGKKYVVFHMRIGYRYYKPQMKYQNSAYSTSILSDLDNTDVNLSGLFFKIGIGYNLTPNEKRIK